jgi:hypothetical protein
MELLRSAHLVPALVTPREESWIARPEKDRRCRSFALATCLASMKNTYTKTEIRISRRSAEVNGLGG